MIDAKLGWTLCFVAVLVGLGWWLWTQWRWVAANALSVPAVRRRLLRPRLPADCPDCQRTVAASPTESPTGPAVRPWRAGRHPGPPRRIATEGYACPQPTCPYFGITGAAVHALIGYGHHGRVERIQDFRCQACGTKVSSRRHTPLYRLKTASATIAQVLLALAEGLDIAAAGRVFGPGHTTITTWLRRTGQHVGSLHAQLFQDLHLAHVQVDELRTSLRARAHVCWLWLAVDPLSKTLPVLYLGARTQVAAHTVVHALRQVLAADCVPVVTSDGLDLYFYALTAHFGAWVGGLARRRLTWQVAARLLYGQVKKVYRRRRLVRVIPRMRWGTLPELRAALRALGFRGTLNTAFIERVNLTVRRGVAGLARRTWATAQTLPQLQAHLEWWRGYYHFVRPHAGLREFLPEPRPRSGHRQPCRYRPRTPAMALGLTDHRWTVQEVLTLPLPA